jgi:hypothetical protein
MVYVGYCCWLRCASGNTFTGWLLLLVYEGPRTTHYTGHGCGLCEVSCNTLYWASLGLMWGAFKIFFFLIIVESKCRFPYHLRNS